MVVALSHPSVPRIVTPVESLPGDLAFLRARMRKPQRHRLLHGYPLAGALPRRGAEPVPDVAFDPAAGRGLLVGVLPHPFCNPAVAGCGFCTFAHQPYRADRAATVAGQVAREVDDRLARQPALRGRPVTALYFGGGTANLTPAGPFRELCRRLAAAFDLTDAEVTLEGVPVYFVRKEPSLLDVVQEELPARHFRVSMGVQTFDPVMLRKMGRQAFGTADTFAEVVRAAHARGFTASADLLFDLPGQTPAGMSADVRAAVGIGLDHLGLYHLVLFRGLGTTWARDPNLLADLPSNDEAAVNWLTLRAGLFAAGFRQTTLTNFERAAFAGDPRRFVYEESSFRPDRFDMLGFGPGAISFAADARFGAGRKTVNPDGADAYLAAGRGGPAADRYFEYGRADLKVFYLTRRLAALGVYRGRYRRLFGTDPVADFPGEVAALRAEGLVEVTAGEVRPTPRGMFYADSVAALFARRQADARRGGAAWALPVLAPDPGHDPALNDNARGFM
jgi:oxygen-independent coproporphyrinogen-3 oxidase